MISLNGFQVLLMDPPFQSFCNYLATLNCPLVGAKCRDFEEVVQKCDCGQRMAHVTGKLMGRIEMSTHFWMIALSSAMVLHSIGAPGIVNDLRCRSTGPSLELQYLLDWVEAHSHDIKVGRFSVFKLPCGKSQLSLCNFELNHIVSSEYCTSTLCIPQVKMENAKSCKWTTGGVLVKTFYVLIWKVDKVPLCRFFRALAWKTRQIACQAVATA